MSTEDLHEQTDDSERFVVPAQKNLQEILEADKDDASLQKWVIF